MLIAHYLHRLPADYDLGAIRRRAAQRGPQWDDQPGLYFKAFLLREKGQFGAAENSYSSLYLWERHEPFRDFLVGDDTATNGFKAVTESFGRPQIRTWLALDARRGEADVARFVHVEEQDIPADASLPTILSHEMARNLESAALPEVVAAAAGVDTLNWKLIRILVLSQHPSSVRGTTFQVLHLARPLLNRLPRS